MLKLSNFCRFLHFKHSCVQGVIRKKKFAGKKNFNMVKRESLHKSKYDGDGSSLSDSFQGWPALISPLTGRAVPTPYVPLPNLVRAMTEARDIIDALARAAKSRRENSLVETRICHKTNLIPSSKLLKRKKIIQIDKKDCRHRGCCCCCFFRKFDG
jgi:hypothetical protein